MISLDKTIKNISLRLSILTGHVKQLNSLNLLDLNIHAENFYRDFLNLIYDSNLINMNTIEKNAPAIDLGDKEKRIAFQVTSTCTKEKIDSTIEKFIEKNLYEDYDRLKFIIITEKKRIKNNLSTQGLFTFNPGEDILDLTDLLKEINNLTQDKLELVDQFISKNIPIENQIIENKVSLEIGTIMALIEYFSQEENMQETDKEEIAPNPTNKVYKRFSDYSDFLIQEYATLATIYSHSLQAASKSIGIDHVRAVKIGSFLRITSDRFLRESDTNPKAALDKLLDFFEKKISSTNKTLDRTAIQFYLIHQLIQCNIFPNEVG